MRLRAPRVMLFALAASSSACAGLQRLNTPAFARLESAVVDDRYAASLTSANVRVVRGGSVVAPSLAMRLLKGDSIATSRTARVVVIFAAGYEVTLDTSTAIYIENPSIFLRIGQAFIRKLVGNRDTEKLDTHTPQATLHDRGTEYLVTVGGQGTDVSVVSGAVEATSRDGRWSGVTYTARQQGRIDTQRGPLPMQRLTEGQLQSRLAWVRRVEAITKVPVPRVESLTEDAARAALQRAGFGVLFVLHRETDAAAPGRVVEQSPGAGETAAPGTFVTLTLAKAPRQQMCTVPGIVGKSVAEANRMIVGARLRVPGTVRDTSAKVATQDPSRNTRVACGTTVKYTLASRIE
jgi:hypothetical protein